MVERRLKFTEKSTQQRKKIEGRGVHNNLRKEERIG